MNTVYILTRLLLFELFALNINLSKCTQLSQIEAPSLEWKYTQECSVTDLVVESVSIDSIPSLKNVKCLSFCDTDGKESSTLWLNKLKEYEVNKLNYLFDYHCRKSESLKAFILTSGNIYTLRIGLSALISLCLHEIEGTELKSLVNLCLLIDYINWINFHQSFKILKCHQLESIGFIFDFNQCYEEIEDLIISMEDHFMYLVKMIEFINLKRIVLNVIGNKTEAIIVFDAFLTLASDLFISDTSISPQIIFMHNMCGVENAFEKEFRQHLIDTFNAINLKINVIERNSFYFGTIFGKSNMPMNDLELFKLIL